MSHIAPLAIHPTVSRIQQMLLKIDRLGLTAQSRHDAEHILVKQVAKVLDRAIPSHAGHGQRTARITDMIGQQLALAHETLYHLRLAALLHDIGLLLLPARLSDFTNQLDSESYRVVRNHARLGGSLLEPFGFLQRASVIVAHHHECWDGSGYPFGIRGPFIPLEARILSVADAFDAITVPSVVDHHMRNLIALRILKAGAGTQFDPEVVKSLDRVVVTSTGRRCPREAD